MPHYIRLTTDRATLRADGEDLAHETARVKDAQNNLCSKATNQLQFAVGGTGRFRAAANGNAASLDLFHAPQMKAFKGRLVVLVQATDKACKAQLEFSSPDLKSDVLKLKTTK